jgi:valyl-tRNA synthetase
LIWNDFCSWYLELVKPPYGEAIDQRTYAATIDFFDKLMRLLHPFMPFISEEIYRSMINRDEEDFIIKAPWPQAEKIDKVIIEDAEETFSIISNIRNLRNANGIAQKKTLDLFVKTSKRDKFIDFNHIICKLANLGQIRFTDDKMEGALHFIIRSDEFFVPVDVNIDKDQQKSELEKDLAYMKGFLASVNKKLGNEKFVNNAPDQVVEAEKKKLEDAIAKIKKLEERLVNL